MGQPCQPLLQEFPLLAGVTLLLQEPAAGILVLQELEHALLQLISKRLQHEILDDQGNVAGDAVVGLLVEGDTEGRLEGEVQKSGLTTSSLSSEILAGTGFPQAAQCSGRAGPKRQLDSGVHQFP